MLADVRTYVRTYERKENQIPLSRHALGRRDNNDMKSMGRVMQPFSAHHLMMLNICTKFQENISKSFRVIELT